MYCYEVQVSSKYGEGEIGAQAKMQVRRVWLRRRQQMTAGHRK